MEKYLQFCKKAIYGGWRNAPWRTPLGKTEKPPVRPKAELNPVSMQSSTRPKAEDNFAQATESTTKPKAEEGLISRAMITFN